jgi:agmatine/peptidylarginine deiminase
MPSTSKKQALFMAAIAHNPAFAKKVGVSQSVGQDFNKADKGKTFKGGGMNNDMKQDMPMMKKVAKQEVKTHEKSMHKMAKGGSASARADGCATKGKTKGTMITMKNGGMC